MSPKFGERGYVVVFGGHRVGGSGKGALSLSGLLSGWPFYGRRIFFFVLIVIGADYGGSYGCIIFCGRFLRGRFLDLWLGQFLGCLS